MTSVYRVMAVWMPVTVVPTSLATVAMDTFMTELSRVMRNWPVASVSSTSAGAGGAYGLGASGGRRGRVGDAHAAYVTGRPAWPRRAGPARA